jgi:hypothetical protein
MDATSNSCLTITISRKVGEVKKEHIIVGKKELGILIVRRKYVN